MQFLATVLSTLAQGTAGGIFGLETIGRISSIALSLAAEGIEGHEKLRNLYKFVQQMVAENREPSEGEWALWEGRDDAADAKIEAAMDRVGANGSESETDPVVTQGS